MKEIPIQMIHPNAIVPQYSTAGAMCFDLFAMEDATVVETYVFATGLKFEIPEGHGMFIFSRSGHGFKHDTRLSNCVGVIDSDYRGEVRVKLRNDSSDGVLRIKRGDAIAQACIMPVERISFVSTDNLSQTWRGENGFGSTDKP